jgi:hypothetical protein
MKPRSSFALLLRAFWVLCDRLVSKNCNLNIILLSEPVEKEGTYAKNI